MSDQIHAEMLHDIHERLRELRAELSAHAARDEAAHASCRAGIEHMVRLLWLGRLAVRLLTALAGLALATLNLKQTIAGLFHQ